MWTVTIRSAIPYEYNGVVSPTRGFQISYCQMQRRTPFMVLNVHIDAFLLKKHFYAVPVSAIYLRYRSVKTQRKDLLFPLTNATTEKDRERPGGPQRWIPEIPNRGKEPTGPESSLPSFSPAATPRPSLLSRKQNGWLVLFFSPTKRERRFSLPYFGHEATRYESVPVSQVRRTRQQLKRSLKMHRQYIRGEGGEEGRK